MIDNTIKVYIWHHVLEWRGGREGGDGVPRPGVPRPEVLRVRDPIVLARTLCTYINRLTHCYNSGPLISTRFGVVCTPFPAQRTLLSSQFLTPALMMRK